MDSITTGDNAEHIKKEFKNWLKKYYEDWKNKNQILKSHLIERQQRNNILKSEIDQHMYNTLTRTTMAMDVIPSKAQILLEDKVNKLKTKSEQLRKCNQTINAKVEEESKNTRKTFFELLTKTDITLKPYHEVEAAAKDIQNQTNSLKQQINEETETYTKRQQKREQDFVEINQIIAVLEPIEQEIRFEIQTADYNLTKYLNSLNLQSAEEATMESSEAKELLKEINNFKSQLTTP